MLRKTSGIFTTARRKKKDGEREARTSSSKLMKLSTFSVVLSRRLYLPATKSGSNEIPKIVAVDLQPMAPVEGVVQIQGDITSEATAMEVIHHFDGGRADLVVCDGAPDVTGLHDLDEYIQSQLVLAAVTIATHVLHPGGNFIAKVFRGKDISLLYSQLKMLFPTVICTKPKSSRNSSIEAFVVCQNYAPPPGFLPSQLQKALMRSSDRDVQDDQSLISRRLIPFLACGDLSGWDADQNYDLQGAEVLEPVQPPTEPAYKEALAKVKRGKTCKDSQ